MRNCGEGSTATGFAWSARKLVIVAAIAAVMSFAASLAVASNASALSLGIDYFHTGTSELPGVQEAGATVYHRPLDYAGTWTEYDEVIEAAWKRGIRIQPYLIDSHVGGAEGNPYLRPSDPAWVPWGAWVREVVERYGINGTFWAGKSNPLPITAWEVWNEPDLVENNPPIGPPAEAKALCKKIGQTYHEKAQNCVQPTGYGNLLYYTANAVQEGAKAKTGTATQVLFGSLEMSADTEWSSFLTKASEGGFGGNVTGLAIHPYSFVNGLTEFSGFVTAARNRLNELGMSSWGLWITEIGWPVYGAVESPTEKFPPGGHPVTENEQAELLTAAFNWTKAVAAADKIEAIDWYAYEGSDLGPKWPEYCGLLRANGSKRPAFAAFQREAGIAPSPLIGMLSTEGKFFAKEQSVGAEWLQVSEGISAISVASDPVHGPLLGELSNAGKFFAKEGSIGAEWVQASEGVSSIAVASDSSNGPLLGEVSSTGKAYVKQGSLGGGWTQISEGVKSIAVASDPINGPLIGIVTTGGKFYAKEGSIGAEWVLESEGISSIALASDPVHGPLIAELSTEGQFYAREGSLVAPWVHLGGGIKQIAVASDSIHGPSIGELFTGGQFYAKQGGLEAGWVFESEGISSIALASDPNFGPLLGEVSPTAHAFVKEGGLESSWTEISPGAKYLSLAG